jgi:hypothetical protein
MVAVGQGMSVGGTVLLVPVPLKVLDPARVAPLFEINGGGPPILAALPSGNPQSNTQFG